MYLKQRFLRPMGYSIWTPERVLVKKISEKELNSSSKKPIGSKLDDAGEDLELTLTPPIITVWQYELAFAISEGFQIF